MKRVTLTIPVSDKVPGDTMRVLCNCDAQGRATGSVDRDIVGDAPSDFWPLAAVDPGWGKGNWNQGDWGGVPGVSPADRTVVSPPLYFGLYQFQAVAYDRAGNAGDLATPTEVFVDSGPQPLTRFRQTGVSGGQPVFKFDPPPQWS